jgi:hypothetical protein
VFESLHQLQGKSPDSKGIRAFLVLWAAADMPGDFIPENFYQLLIHIFIVVRNIQANNVLALQLGSVALAYSPRMLFLHRKNYIRPTEHTGRYLNPRVVFRSRRARFYPRQAAKHSFGSQAAPFILAAQKQ